MLTMRACGAILRLLPFRQAKSPRRDARRKRGQFVQKIGCFTQGARGLFVQLQVISNLIQCLDHARCVRVLDLDAELARLWRRGFSRTLGLQALPELTAVLARERLERQSQWQGLRIVLSCALDLLLDQLLDPEAHTRVIGDDH